MQHELTIENDGSLFVVTTHGNGDVEGIIAFLNDIISHPQWKPGTKILLDHRDLNISQIFQKGISQVSQYFIKIGPVLGKGKIALVMHQDINYGIARAWELMTADDVDISIFVFRTIEEARKWLAE